MEAYTDPDFGACLDTINRRSVSGTVVMLAKGVVS